MPEVISPVKLEPQDSYRAVYVEYGFDAKEGVRQIAMLSRSLGGDPRLPVLEVPMPCCGQIFVYPTDDDIPAETTPCPCGAPNRWIIFYEERL